MLSIGACCIQPVLSTQNSLLSTHLNFRLPYIAVGWTIAGRCPASCEKNNMDALKAAENSFEVDHQSGLVTLTLNSGDNPVSVSLSVVQASQLVALLHKHINEAAVEKLRRSSYQ